jgi:D-amino-acid dehydrogenase
VLVDRHGPGGGASFSNGGLIQREAVYPHPFPRALAELQRFARNRAVDAAYHPLALPPSRPPAAVLVAFGTGALRAQCSATPA